MTCEAPFSETCPLPSGRRPAQRFSDSLFLGHAGASVDRWRREHTMAPGHRPPDPVSVVAHGLVGLQFFDRSPPGSEIRMSDLTKHGHRLGENMAQQIGQGPKQFKPLIVIVHNFASPSCFDVFCIYLRLFTILYYIIYIYVIIMFIFFSDTSCTFFHRCQNG